MPNEVKAAAASKRRIDEHARLPPPPAYKGTARPSGRSSAIDKSHNNMPPTQKRKHAAKHDQPNKKVKTEAAPSPPPPPHPRARPALPGTITMGMLKSLAPIPKRQTTSAPSADAPPRASSFLLKKRKRSDSAATEDGSGKKSRKESLPEEVEASKSIKKEVLVPMKKSATKASAPKKTTATSKPASSSKPAGVICPMCGAEQARSNNMARHQRGSACQKRAYLRKHGEGKVSPPASQTRVEAATKVSSPDSKKSAAVSKASPGSRVDSTSTKRTSISPAAENSSRKRKAPLAEAPALTSAENTKEPTRTTVPIGLLNMRGVSAQNAALQIFFSTLTEEEIEILCTGDEPNMFNLKDEELVKYDSAGHPRKRCMFDIKFQEAKDKIIKAAFIPKGLTDEELHDPNRSSEPAIKLGPYLGQLFKKMRAAEESGEPTEITAMMLQTVFALSGKKFLSIMDESGTELKTALTGRKILDIFEQDTDETAGEYLTKLINALAREHPFVLEKFNMKIHNIGHCSHESCDGKHQELTQNVALTATVPAEHYDLRIGDDDDVYECEIQHSTNYIIQKRLGYDQVSDVSCPEVQSTGERCDGMMEVKPCIIQYPEYLLIPIEREDAEAPLQMVNLMAFEVGEQKYRMTGMVQRDDRTGHNVAFREVEGKWWKLSDENVESVTPAGLQDGCRRKSCVVLLRKV